MKLNLTWCLMLALPLFSFAQNEPLPVEFAKSAKSANTLWLDDHNSIVAINNDNESLDIVAVNDGMQSLWKTAVKGHLIGLTKFKNNVVAVTATEYSQARGDNNTYMGYVVNAATGKLISSKQIYQGPVDYMLNPLVLSGEGNFLRLLVRQTGMTKKIHFTLLENADVAFARDFNQTISLEALDFNENLDLMSSFKVPVPNGSFISAAYNNNGEMFTAWLNGPSVEMYYFQAGQKAPSSQLNLDVTFKEDKKIIPATLVRIAPSKNKKGLIFFALNYKNTDKDMELALGKFDFTAGTKNYAIQIFSKDNMKQLKKSFIPVNKKIDDVDMGYPGNMMLRYFGEKDGNLVTALSSQMSVASSVSSGGYWMVEYATVINIHDNNLKLKTQQIFPTSYSYPMVTLPTSFHMLENKLYVVGNIKKGMTTINGLYGELDMNTGAWKKMELLSKKKIDNSDYSGNLLWFNDKFGVLYYSKRGLLSSKYDLILQPNVY